jgi:trk system potassium uptake protein
VYIIVAGGGKVGYYLTKTLINAGYEVLLIEKDRKKVDIYLERFGSIVVRGDACEASVCEEAGMQRADVVVAVTGDDEDNLVICQLAKKRFRVPRTVARVNNPKNEEVLKRLGVDVTVSQTNFIMNLIEQEIPAMSLVHLLTIRHSNLALVEAEISDRSKVVGRRIGDVDMPADTCIALVIRDQKPLIPNPDTRLLADDEVIAMAKKESEQALRDLFVGPEETFPV